jgi:hypothetical protein
MDTTTIIQITGGVLFLATLFILIQRRRTHVK